MSYTSKVSTNNMDESTRFIPINLEEFEKICPKKIGSSPITKQILTLVHICALLVVSNKTKYPGKYTFLKTTDDIMHFVISKLHDKLDEETYWHGYSCYYFDCSSTIEDRIRASIWDYIQGCMESYGNIFAVHPRLAFADDDKYQEEDLKREYIEMNQPYIRSIMRNEIEVNMLKEALDGQITKRQKSKAIERQKVQKRKDMAQSGKQVWAKLVENKPDTDISRRELFRLATPSEKKILSKTFEKGWKKRESKFTYSMI